MGDAPSLRGIGTIVSARLTPPCRGGLLVERRGLDGKIAAALSKRLVLVCAPAGYGKTSILATAYERARASGAVAGWISIERGDDSLIAFLRLFVAAVQTVRPEFGLGLATLTGSGIALPAEILEMALLQELSSIEEDYYVFIDDYHTIQSTEVDALLDHVLLSNLPRFHLLIAARNAPRLALSRLRVAGLVREIVAADLEFSEDETERLLLGNGAIIDGGTIAKLHRRTEGWVAGIQLVGLTIANGQDAGELVESLSGELGNISDFLVSEVLRGQSDETSAFLLESAVFTRFDAQLCDDVLEIDRSARIISKLRDEQLFIFELDRDRRWFRYHHLFSEFLSRRLRDENEPRWRELHERAIVRLNERGFVREAFEHCCVIGAYDKAGALLDGASSTMFAAGEIDLLIKLSQRLPDSVAKGALDLQLELAWVTEINWQFDRAKHHLENVRTALASNRSGDRDRLRRMRSKLAHREMMLSVFSDDLPTARREAHDWVESQSIDEPFMLASAGTTQILVSRELGVISLLPHRALQLRDLFLEADAHYGVVFHDCLAGRTFFSRGDLDIARDHYQRALESARRLHGPHSPLAAMPACFLAELYYEQNKLADAGELLGSYPLELSSLGFVDNLMASFMIRAKLAYLHNDTSEGEELLRSGLALATENGFNRLATMLRSEMQKRGVVESILAFGVSLSGAVLGEFELESECLSVAIENRVMVVRAAESSAGEAALDLARVAEHAVQRQAYREALRAFLYAAVGTARTGPPRSAQDYLENALHIAQKHDFVRSVIDEGDDVLNLLEQYAKARDTSRSLREFARLLLSIVRRPALLPSPSMSHNASAEWDLTEREYAVIRAGVESRSNREIGELLGLTENTVKWYWREIFSKLNVNRKSEAIAIVRSAGGL